MNWNELPLNLARQSACRADEKNWQTLYHTLCIHTGKILAALVPAHGEMGMLYMSAPFETLLGLLLSNSNDQQVERPCVKLMWFCGSFYNGIGELQHKG
jgi:hypothetical protein